MTVKNLRAQADPNNNDLTSIQPSNAALPPDIPAPSDNDVQPLYSQMGFYPTPTVGLITDAAALSTSTIPTSTPLVTPTSSTSSSTSPSTASATPTNTAAAATSHGLSQGKLAVAIVIPMAALAILIPVISLCFLSRRRRARERNNASQRNSHTRDPMVQRPIFYAGSWPSRQRRSSSQGVLSPTQTRNSLGLFNFGLSPTASTNPRSPPASRDSMGNSRARFSVARALELRRSQPNVVTPHARTSDARVTSPPSAHNAGPASIERSPSGGGRSILDTPPAYTSSPALDVDEAKSHFAPLSRIGTLHSAERSPPRPPKQNAHEPDRSTYASSDAIRDNDTYGRLVTRGISPVNGLQRTQGFEAMFTRKPVPTAPKGTAAYERPLYQPSHLPERMSDVSGFTIDTTQWDDRPRHESTVSSVISPIENDISTVHPYNPV